MRFLHCRYLYAVAFVLTNLLPEVRVRTDKCPKLLRRRSGRFREPDVGKMDYRVLESDDKADHNDVGIRIYKRPKAILRISIP